MIQVKTWSGAANQTMWVPNPDHSLFHLDSNPDFLFLYFSCSGEGATQAATLWALTGEAGSGHGLYLAQIVLPTGNI
jgi:hypothetical protein